MEITKYFRNAKQVAESLQNPLVQAAAFAVALASPVMADNSTTTSLATSAHNETSMMTTMSNSTSHGIHMSDYITQMDFNSVAAVTATLLATIALCLSVRNCRQQSAQAAEQRSLLPSTI